MKKILLLFCMMLSGLGWINTSNAQSVDVQFIESPNSDCVNGTVCYIIQVKSDDGGVLLGSSSIRFNYDPSVILFDGFFQEGSTAGNYLNAGTYTDLNFTSLPACAGQNYLDHSYDGSIAGDFLITVVFNDNAAFPNCIDLTSGAWIDVSEICFQIVNPSGNPLLEFQGNENGPATVSSFEDTNFNDGTNNVSNKYLNGSFGDYNTITLDNSCNCFPCICAPETPPTITTNSTILCPAGTTGGTSPVLNAGGIAPAGYTFQWQVNGNIITGATGQTYSPNSTGTYTVYLVSTDTGLCDTTPSNSIVITSGISGCTNAAACNYNVNATCDDGSCDLPDGCTDATACNFDPTATCDNGSCILPNGCTNTAACNYDPTATCDDGTCDLPDGCTNAAACNFDATATCDDGTCDLPDGCTDATACNFDATATCDNGSCILPNGCTDATACNFDATATCDDGTCEFTSCQGCTDNTACNFDSAATIDDGSCNERDCLGNCTGLLTGPAIPGAACDDGDPTTTGDVYNSSCVCGGNQILGCTDNTACNFDPTATLNDGSCNERDCLGNCIGSLTGPAIPGTTCDDGDPTTIGDVYNSSCVCDGNQIPGCTNAAACNYDLNATLDDGSCTLPGCTDNAACNFDPVAGCLDAGSCVYPAGCSDIAACNYTPDLTCPDDSSCDFGSCAGCTDPCSGNYDASATTDDGTCTDPLIGCMNAAACNFDPTALCSNVSTPCDFSCYGCTDVCSPNYNASATLDDGSCLAQQQGCLDQTACNYDPSALCDDSNVCEFLTCAGCTNVCAPNYDASATIDDGTCMASLIGCTDLSACNYDPNALCADQNLCDYISCIGTDCQLNIPMPYAGWHMISSYCNPLEDSITQVFSPIVNDIIQVKNLTGQVYVPSFNNFNTFTTWDITQGYLVKTFSPVTLPIIGGLEVDLAVDDIPLYTGWNMIAYWLQGDSDPVDVFDAVASDVIQVKNLSGAYVPSFNDFNNMGNMTETRGYQVKMATGNTLQYDAVDILPRPAPGAYEETEVLQPVHFTKEIKPNPNSATLIIMDGENNPLNFGDELGIFTQDGILVGSFVYQNDMMGGLAFGDDDTSDEMDGMKEGESYVFKVWDKLLNKVRTVEMNFSQGSTTYLKDDLCALSFKANASTGIADINNKININANPNPASSEITFKIELQEQSTLLIEVFKVDGQLVEVVANQNFNVGLTNVKYDVNNLSNGLYMYRVTMGDQVLTKRFTVAN